MRKKKTTKYYCLEQNFKTDFCLKLLKQTFDVVERWQFRMGGRRKQRTFNKVALYIKIYRKTHKTFH